MLIPLPFHGHWSEFHRMCGSSVCRSSSACIYWEIPIRTEIRSTTRHSGNLYRDPRYARSCIVCTNVAESGVTVPNVGLVISSGVQRRVSTDIRTGSTVNALQTLSKAQLLQQLGRTGRTTDRGIHVTMMSHDQYLSQVRSSDLAQLEESDISPMILRSLVAGRSFARLPFLCPPHPMVQTHTKEKTFLHGILDTKGESRMGHATACMDLPCEWAQFLYVCAERGLEDSALILIATWYREGPAMTQQFNVNHGHPDGDLVTSILAYEWFLANKRHYQHKYSDWKTVWTQEWKACSKVGLTHHVMVAIHESVLVLQQVFSEHRHAFPEVTKRHFGSPGNSTLLLHSVWTSFFDRCLTKLPTGEYVSPQNGGSWALESSSLCHHPTAIVALNRTIRDRVSYVSCLTPIPEEWLIEKDWYIVNHWENKFLQRCLPGTLCLC